MIEPYSTISYFPLALSPPIVRGRKDTCPEDECSPRKPIEPKKSHKPMNLEVVGRAEGASKKLGGGKSTAQNFESEGDMRMKGEGISHWSCHSACRHLMREEPPQARGTPVSVYFAPVPASPHQ